MKVHGMLEVKEGADRVYIEYGAGRAGLSSYVAERMSGEDGPKDSIKFIIVDRDTRRRKLDKNFREDFLTMREKMDIADFNLEKFIELKQAAKEIKEDPELLCIAKHLCGGATDLSLTSIIDKQKRFKGKRSPYWTSYFRFVLFLLIFRILFRISCVLMFLTYFGVVGLFLSIR